MLREVTSTHPLHLIQVLPPVDKRASHNTRNMAPGQLEDGQGNTLSTSRRGIFPFMSLPAEIRIKIYKIVSSPFVCVPYRPHKPYSHLQPTTVSFRDQFERYCSFIDKEDSIDEQDFIDKTDPFPFPPQVKALLQVEQIREDMLPHLHVVWVGSLRPGIDPYWPTFKDSIIPAVSHLTIGVEDLFDSNSGRVCRDPDQLLCWMQHLPRRNLTHLTLIDGSSNWPRNPLHIPISFGEPERPPSTDLLRDPPAMKAYTAVRSFPMIQGLTKLKLVLNQQPSKDFLDRLSQKCASYEIDLQYTVQGPSTREFRNALTSLGLSTTSIYSTFPHIL